jgi:hypothetical protein
MKAGAKEYLLGKFDRHELRGKAAGEPARATGKVPRMGPLSPLVLPQLGMEKTFVR